MSCVKTTWIILMVIVSGPLFFSIAGADETSDGDAYGVFECVIEQAAGSVTEISTALETAATDAGWLWLTSLDAGLPKDCPYNSRVICIYDPTYAAALMNANRLTGAYGIVDRIGIFEDENGTHVAVVNPNSISRTILMDDLSFGETSEAHLQALRQMIITSVTGTESSRQYGQLRMKGYIGKTMGVVAGGKFSDMIKDKGNTETGTLREVADRLKTELGKTSKKWGLHSVYEVELNEFGIIVLGINGAKMSSKSFEIVGAGADESRKNLTCPGIAYAAAYPLEIILSSEDGKVNVRMVEAMFRMKMYFEDAGKWAFMNNMKMPGSIDKELKKQIKNGLKSK